MRQRQCRHNQCADNRKSPDRYRHGNRCNRLICRVGSSPNRRGTTCALKLIVEDDRTSNAGAVAALQLLVTQHPHLAAIIGPMLSTEVQAMTPLIEQYQIPVLVGGTDPKITHEGDRWIFRVRPNDEYSARTMAYFVIKRLGLRRVAVVHSTDAFGTGEISTSKSGYPPTEAKLSWTKVTPTEAPTTRALWKLSPRSIPKP